MILNDQILPTPSIKSKIVGNGWCMPGIHIYDYQVDAEGDTKQTKVLRGEFIVGEAPDKLWCSSLATCNLTSACQ